MVSTWRRCLLLPQHIHPSRWLELEQARVERGVGLKRAELQDRALAEADDDVQADQRAALEADADIG